MSLHHASDNCRITSEMGHSIEELGSQLRTSSGQCIPLAGRALGKSTTRAPKDVYSTHCCSQTLYVVLLGTAQVIQGFPRYHCHTSHDLQIQKNGLNYICECSRAHRKNEKAQ